MDNVMSDVITNKDYNYAFTPSACASCGGACCTGESGYIWIKYPEMKKMAEFLELTLEEFATMYLKKVKHRYSLIEKKLDRDGVYFLMTISSSVPYIQ